MTADPNPPAGITVFCDPPLRPAFRALAPQAGIPIAVLSAPAAAMLEQIQRHTRNDVLMTISTAMDQAVSRNFVDPKTRIDGFSNPLVLAVFSGRFANGAPTAKPAVRLSGLRVAVTDNTSISGLDGAAVLAANGFAPGACRLLGAASTQDALFLLLTGAVDAALVYRTDAHSNPDIAILATLTADPALISFSAAVNAKAVSPNAQNLLNLMRSPAGAAILQQAGLEFAA